MPLRGQPVTVALLGAGDVSLSTALVTTDSSGVAQIPDHPAAITVRVTDRFGNQVSGAIP